MFLRKRDVLEMIAIYGEKMCNTRPIGKVYEMYYSYMGSSTYRHWTEFRSADVQDRVEDKIKINNHWHDKDDVIMYADLYKAQEKAIEKRYAKEKT